jgi:hypothetical protein
MKLFENSQDFSFQSKPLTCQNNEQVKEFIRCHTKTIGGSSILHSTSDMLIQTRYNEHTQINNNCCILKGIFLTLQHLDF